MPPPVRYRIFLADALHWLESAAAASIHAVVTDPPYGIVEYSPSELKKRDNRKGGIWRLPHSYDGHTRNPVPRFTVLGPRDHERIRRFFRTFAKELSRVLVPGAHVFLASNPLVSHLVSNAFVSAGFEKRGEIVRVTQTLRGGGSSQECARRILGHVCHSAIVLGTMAAIQGTLRRKSSRQPSQMACRRTAKALTRRAL